MPTPDYSDKIEEFTENENEEINNTKGITDFYKNLIVMRKNYNSESFSNQSVQFGAENDSEYVLQSERAKEN